MDTKGLIQKCDSLSEKCHHKCCVFDGNYIVMFPGEFEGRKLEKYPIKIIDDDYNGGKKAACDYHQNGKIAHNRICAHAHFKPLDCKSYPYFPFVDKNDKFKILKGTKCPLTEDELKEHKTWFLKTWREVMKKDPKIKEWVKKVELVGYELLDEVYDL